MADEMGSYFNSIRVFFRIRLLISGEEISFVVTELDNHHRLEHRDGLCQDQRSRHEGLSYDPVLNYDRAKDVNAGGKYAMDHQLITALAS